MKMSLKHILGWGLVILGLSMVLLAFFSTDAKATNNSNVTICHKNNGNGWSRITVDDDAVNGQGNGDHNSSQHQNGQDIIPPGYWDFNGRNWDTTGQAIWNNNCNIPQPSPTPSPTPTPTPTPTTIPTPTPTPMVCEQGTHLESYLPEGVEITEENSWDECVPDVTPTPEATPSATPVPEEPKHPSEPESPKAPSCSEPAPVVQPRNFGCYRSGSVANCEWVPGSESVVDIFYSEGKVTTPPESWPHSKAVLYRENPINGRTDIGDLVPGRDYTFALRSRNACSGGQFLYHVVIDSDGHGVYFPLSYWYLSK